jgi:hypothetical protein
MNETNFFRKYIDIINEAPATAINPNDPNAAAFGKSINTPTQQNNTATSTSTPAAAINPNDKNAAAFGKSINAPTQSAAAPAAGVNNQATAARDRLQQQMASGKITTPAPQTVNPNQQYGGGYDPNKVQYASGTNPKATQTANTTPPSASLDQSKANAIGGNTQTAQATTTAQPTTAPSQPSLASQYVTANQPQAATQPTTASVGSKPPATEPSLASQYVSANQPQTVAEEDNDGEDDLLKSIIRLIKQ